MVARKCRVILHFTSSTASRAANARISAQETTPGQKISRTLFAESITENAPSDLLAGSLLSVSFPCNNIDASQPCYIIP